ncbi:MAG: nuclear transport factor 2 family protein [Acidobacteriota bacterium]|nr:nuclear transport factor 2 family protein [Acidobacteriota bacterium]MDH3785182.1 nuclear transport factor 2 family protein [Acidobacteriota bacterium]
MKKTIVLSLFLLFCAAPLLADGHEEAAIKKLIEESYVHGAFNELNPEAMRAGFHPDFAIYSADGEAIKKYPIVTWSDGVAKRKAAADFDPAGNKWEHTFVSVDVTGGSAAVKIELSNDGKLKYTDYLSLLKFDSGWKIVAKVYHSHK